MSRTEAVASVTPSDFVVDEMSEALIKRMHYPLFMMLIYKYTQRWTTHNMLLLLYTAPSECVLLLPWLDY
jgi:hypothetical protein